MAGIWLAWRDRLRSAGMTALLGGPERVYVATESFPTAEAPGGYWARVLVIPARTLWERPESYGRARAARALVRVDIHVPGPGFDPAHQIDLVHAEAFRRLHGWHSGDVPGAAIPAHVERLTETTAPEYDSELGLWWSSAEYATTAARPAASD
jgi:hypothetical protein